MDSQRVLTLRPIGYVVKGRPWPTGDEPWQENVSEIEIDASWAEALEGLEGFSHIWILWWLDRFPDPPEVLRVRSGGRPNVPLVGIFATRSPHRPNPIALTPVRLLEREGSRLRVVGLDAVQGTPVLDIKPYLRRGDLIAEATGPRWME